MGLATAKSLSGVNAGGRRLKTEQPLFSRPLHSLRQPKQWGSGQPGHRRLSEQEGEQQPQLFTRKASSLGQNKWGQSTP